MREESHKMALQLKHDKQMNEEARLRALAQIKEDREKQRLLRGTGPSTSSTPKYRPPALLSERENFQQKIKMQKQLDRAARDRVLDDIRRDREERRLQASKTHTKNLEASSASAATLSPAAPPPSQEHKEKMALVQFRLSDGSSVRQKFGSDAPLSRLYAYAKENETRIGKQLADHETLVLISAFPRREFSQQDQELTVEEAGKGKGDQCQQYHDGRFIYVLDYIQGFLPNVSLNVLHRSALNPVHPEADERMVEEVRIIVNKEYKTINDGV
ncbi:hypothetical protein BX666DRAFT_41093 [Dichotomocladium elegans]|nr:hypothetical protein BX666DRAFT_41093 [Dichotomocladium elegans]